MTNEDNIQIGFIRPLSQGHYALYIRQQEITDNLIRTLATHASAWQIVGVRAPGVHVIPFQGGDNQLPALCRRAATLGNLNFIPYRGSIGEDIEDIRPERRLRPLRVLGFSPRQSQLQVSEDQGQTFSRFIPENPPDFFPRDDRSAARPDATPPGHLTVFSEKTNVIGDVLYPKGDDKPTIWLVGNTPETVDPESLQSWLREMSDAAKEIWLPKGDKQLECVKRADIANFATMDSDTYSRLLDLIAKEGSPHNNLLWEAGKGFAEMDAEGRIYPLPPAPGEPRYIRRDPNPRSAKPT